MSRWKKNLKKGQESTENKDDKKDELPDPFVKEHKQTKYEKFRDEYIKKMNLSADRFHIIKLIGKMIDHELEVHEPKIKLPESTYFKCNKCGKCCKNAQYRIPITISDCVSWLNSNNTILLRALDHNRGHPKNMLFFITKRNFAEDMFHNHGKNAFNHFIKLNPSLNEISKEDENDCVFYNSESHLCSIYQFRPLYCSVYPYPSLFDLKMLPIYSKSYRKIAKMPLKDKEFKSYMKKIDQFEILCPESVIAKTDENLRILKKKKIQRRLQKLIIADLFSGALYFKNRKDVTEDIMFALFAKRL